jgi:hypothetical protein
MHPGHADAGAFGEPGTKAGSVEFVMPFDSAAALDLRRGSYLAPGSHNGRAFGFWVPLGAAGEYI